MAGEPTGGASCLGVRVDPRAVAMLYRWNEISGGSC